MASARDESRRWAPPPLRFGSWDDSSLAPVRSGCGRSVRPAVHWSNDGDDLYEQLLGTKRPWRVRDAPYGRDPGSDLRTSKVQSPPASHYGAIWTRSSSARRRRKCCGRAVPTAGSNERGSRGRTHKHGSRRCSRRRRSIWRGLASFAAVARQCRLSWNQVAGVGVRAVERGLSRRTVATAGLVGVDESSFRRRHASILRHRRQGADGVGAARAVGATASAIDGYSRELLAGEERR